MTKQPYLFLILFLTNIAFGQNKVNKNWPKIIRLEQLTITIYQPQIEALYDNHVEARAAFNIFDGARLPVFGAMWVKARVHIDRSNHSVIYDNLKVTAIHFPDANEEDKEAFIALLKAVMPTWNLRSTLDDFYAADTAIKIDNQSTEVLNNEPPNIFYEEKPTELVFIDGEPILANVAGSELYKYVVNTPYFIIYSLSDKYYYLKAGQWWYRAPQLYDNWQPLEAAPGNIIDLEVKYRQFKSQEINRLNKENFTRPQLYVVTYPAALIEVAGTPDWAELSDSSLLYCVNTANDLLLDSHTQQYYVRFSGRWYRSPTLQRGKWVFVAPNALPDYFRLIPPDSKVGRVRVSVPGTPEAMQAALDNYIPQTAIVDRQTAEMSVEYDGKPVFEPIEGTTLQYAINTASSILKTADNKYFAVDEAIWFTADSPEGPWQVAVTIPDEVQQIPPTCPVYNIKYVYIYEYDDKLVYEGYTGGYLGAFLYQGCVFYGTGYQYKLWYKSKYVPRPVTWAFGVNRTNGSNSKVHISVGVGYGYGFPGYYPYYPYYPYYGGYGMYRFGSVDGNYTYKKGYESKPLDVVNIYNNRPRGIVATVNTDRSTPQTALPLATPANGWLPPANMYTDKDGHLYKQDRQGQWYQRQDGVWVQVQGRPENE